MKQSDIIIIINKKPYTLNVSNAEAIRSIPSTDRRQLITLLEVIKAEEVSAHQSALNVNASIDTSSTETGNTPGKGLPERLRAGDVDAVMAQLIMEEDLKKKPGLTKQTIHKWIAVIAVSIILLILML
ncbi:MAG: hypothetical protein OQK69_11455 [Gammaproteobacteria bacterium]|nr:hypothetical protein [Gammaproteobacteria bacterium]